MSKLVQQTARREGEEREGGIVSEKDKESRREREKEGERVEGREKRERERKRIIVLFVRELEMNIQVNFELMLNCFYFHCQRLLAQGHIQQTLIKLVTTFFA